MSPLILRNVITEPPSSCLKRLYYDAVGYRAGALALYIQVGGADKVMYGSDYTHDIGDMKGCRARVDCLTEDQRAADAHENAEWILKL